MRLKRSPSPSLSMEDAAAVEKPEQLALRERNAELEGQLELLCGVLALVKEDLHVKSDQIDRLYDTFLSSKERKRQEQDQREKELKQQVGRLETQIREKDESYQRVHQSLQDTLLLLHGRSSGAVDLGPRGNSTQVQELPAVLVTNVLSYLDCTSVIRAAQTHRNWYAVVTQRAFWADHYLQRWQAADERQPWASVHMFASKYTNPRGLLTQECHENGELKALDESQVDWKALYRERHEVERNWTSGKSIITTLNGHYGTVTCLQFNEDRMVSGSDDGSMMLWSLSPQNQGEAADHPGFAGSPLVQQHHRQMKSVIKLHSFHGHGGPVWALCFDETTLISGSYDKTVKLWDLQTGNCQRTLRGHTGWVSSLASHENRIVSAGWDSCIKIWDKDMGVLLRTLEDAAAHPIFALKWDRRRNTFITGCRRVGVQLWDAESGQKLTQFVGHPQVNTIKACGERIISGGSDHAVKVWDRRQGTCASTLTGHKGAVMSVDYNHDNHVISGSYDATIKLWDLRSTSKPVGSFEGHSSAVFALQMDAAKLVSGSADTTIKIFNFHHLS